MRYIFKFPDIGEGLTEGKILKWHVSKGQAIKAGDPVVEMETDKVVTDIPSPQDGMVVGRFGQEGEVINVGDALLELEIPGVEGEEARRIAAEKPRGKSEAPVEEPGFGVVGTLEVAGEASFMPSSNEGLPEPPEEKPRDTAPRRKVLATPVARAMAREMGIDIQSVRGTGPGTGHQKRPGKSCRGRSSTDRRYSARRGNRRPGICGNRIDPDSQGHCPAHG